MRIDHQDYTKLVIEAYTSKRANNELSPLLARSTPANIRRECANVYQERYERRDEQALRAFFGPVEHGRKFLQTIQKFEADRFRPIDSYLKGRDKNLNPVNLELLAWLIDFQHRPYGLDKNIVLNDEEQSIIGKTIITTGKNQTEKEQEQNDVKEKEESAFNTDSSGTLLKKEPDTGPVEITDTTQIRLHTNLSDNKWKPQKVVIIFLVVVICLGGAYAIWQQKRDKRLAIENAYTGCMYWVDDHYEEIPCNEKRNDRLKLPRDLQKMRDFKKIMREDTITERSIGKIYYIKINGRIEYYTASGNHPIEVNRHLKPLSSYMFGKYLAND